VNSWPDWVQVDLAGAEGQRAAARAEGDRLHAQHPLVERDGPLGVGHGQHEMVQAGDGDRRHRGFLRHHPNVSPWILA
jgi:hypothetical protein